MRHLTRGEDRAGAALTLQDGREGCSRMADTDPNEAELESAFREGADFGVEFLDSQCREHILRYIKKVSCGFLDADELLVVYQETLIGVLEFARQADFDPSRPMRIVYRIARFKAADYRRCQNHRANTNEDGILDAVAADVKDTDLGFQWKLHIGPSEARELHRILPEIIADLPPRQRLVAQCFVDNFEDFSERKTYKLLADAVSRVTGKAESVAGVKSAWRFAREKIVAELHRRGYTFLPVE